MPGDYCMWMCQNRKVVMGYSSNLSVTLVSILQDMSAVLYLCIGVSLRHRGFSKITPLQRSTCLNLTP